MPFYRSVLAGGGSGGGGNSPYVTFESRGALPTITLARFSSNNDEEITKLTLGNQVFNASSFCQEASWQSIYHDNFNASIDLNNAERLAEAACFLESCPDFNSPVTFPNFSYGNYYSWGEGNSSSMNYSYFFNNCQNYNQPTTLRFHEVSSTDNEGAYLSMECFFADCYSFNSRVIFDFDKANKSTTNSEEAMIQYSCGAMFAGCNHFNQPLIFPAGITNTMSMFYNCENFNQPVVFDLNLGAYYISFSELFRTAPNMCADIIFLNSNNMKYQDHMFDYLVNNTRSNTINIFIDNVTGIKNNNLTGQGTITWTEYASPYGYTTYANSAYKIQIIDNAQYGLDKFNNYYNNFYNLG